MSYRHEKALNEQDKVDQVQKKFSLEEQLRHEKKKVLDLERRVAQADRDLVASHEKNRALKEKVKDLQQIID